MRVVAIIAIEVVGSKLKAAFEAIAFPCTLAVPADTHRFTGILSLGDALPAIRTETPFFANGLAARIAIANHLVLLGEFFFPP